MKLVKLHYEGGKIFINPNNICAISMGPGGGGTYIEMIGAEYCVEESLFQVKELLTLNETKRRPDACS